MAITNLSAILGVIISLSVASERLVEITKGLIPWLNTENPAPKAEGWRRAILQTLAVGAGVLTAYLARDYFPPEVAKQSTIWTTLALGLLASGGSGFWNAILTYVLETKNIKEAQAIREKKAVS